MMHQQTRLLAILAFLAFGGAASAAVSPEEAGKLGDTLTPWGAIAGGNDAGTIPPYTGGIQPPAAYDPGRPGIRPDPFADEKPRLTITRANLGEHQDKLSEGVKAMFERYPTFRMDVYPTHRTARYPDWFLENARKNATSCETAADGLQLRNCHAGTPFPIPQSGVEVMWNRYLKYEQHAFRADDLLTTVVDANGSVMDTAGWRQWNQYPLWDGQTGALKGDELTELLRADYTAPARKNGEKLVIQDGLDMVNSARRAWSYLVGQRRVKLSPDVAYDTPSPTGAGIGTVDDSSVFFGAFDRYDFELVGRKEMYIPYNMLKLQDQQQCGRDVVFTKNHLNPDCVRWELHRVWVVEATLKDGKRHIYPRRTLYYDEDFLGVGMGDSYDGTGAIYRVTLSESFPFYESTGHVSGQFIVHDLQSGAYVRQAYTSGRTGWYITEPQPQSLFSPSSMAGSGIR
ncbi:DUF1329 domain-containing protein [Stutzerimonas tarimensis]|uniref:DUF1329 domain-containing protein n=1 Tax=Stutzerimonas tarimensis TaxID=1507735 RepID=A0ABV7T7F3_9GAMM